MTTTTHILAAINKIFASNEGRRNIATEYLNQYSGSLGTLYPLLDDLCNCNFETLANLKNIIPTASEKSTINNALIAAGGNIPASSTCGKVGTLGSFYSCTGLFDGSQSLVATGSELCADKILAEQQCDNWAKSKAIYSYSSTLTFDKSGGSVFYSNSPTGNCIQAVGGMKTKPSSLISPMGGKFIIPSLDINCYSSSCSTVAITIFDTGGNSIALPSIAVVCAADNSCATSSYTYEVDVNLDGVIDSLSIPALEVDFISPTEGTLAGLCKPYLDVA